VTSISKTSWLETLFPGYFAMVMATGITSIDASFLEMPLLAQALFALNAVAWTTLWILNVARIIRYPAAVLADLRNPSRAVTFLTVVAGTCILGNQFALLTSYAAVARGLWIVGVVFWLFLIYSFFAAATLREPKPSLAEGINGAWLLVVVSTQSISVLGTLIARGMTRPGAVLFVSLAMFLLGTMLYMLLFVLILYRWLFFDLRAEVMTPPYWINMGALAITTLAGARLLLVASVWVQLEQFVPIIKGVTLTAWVTASWWIPLLVILGVWRHGIRRIPIVYEPAYWALVFPLGMYTACTIVLTRASKVPLPEILPSSFFWIALAAWTLTFIGMGRGIIRGES
jgi:tellurite resistance protein TehA-like permease